MSQGLMASGHRSHRPPAPGRQPEALARIAREVSERAGLPVELLTDYLPLIVTTVVDGSPPSGQELDRWRQRGRIAAGDGLPLRAVTGLHLAAVRALWPRLAGLLGPDGGRVPPGSVVAAGERVLETVDRVVDAVAAGHAERRRMTPVDAELAGRLIDGLADRSSDGAQTLESAERLGVDTDGRHAVAIVQIAAPAARGGRHESRLRDGLSGFLPRFRVVVSARDGLLVAVVATAADGTPRPWPNVARALSGAVDGWAGTGWSVAVGRERRALLGARRSYDEAREALAIAGRLGLQDRVLPAERLLTHRILMRDRAALADLVRVTVGPLAAARGGAEPLLRTLEVYFDCGGVSAHAARTLHLSVRAVTYRLAKVGELTGQSLTDPTDRVSLQAAVLGARLLDWPRRPLPGSD